ncbi:MAG: ribonuclease HII [Tissierellia bacterium]|nr:ribonuclease HII [Tissierellia bacterium]
MEYCIESEYRQEYICGIDEVGRGCLAGPVVAAAVIMPKEYLEEIDDSKKLSKKKREKMDTYIRENAIAFGIAEIDVETIDKINIKQASRLAMKKAVEEMVRKYEIEPEILLIDSENIETDYEQVSIIRGDSLSYNIACASILAKVYRDSLFVEYEERYPGYSFITNMGYGTAAHIDGIKKNGVLPIHRKSFMGKILKRIKDES